jgi:hypothetical protein
MHDVGFTLGVQLLWPVSHGLVPYGGVGARMHLTHSVMEANAGSTDLLTNTEDSTRFGFLARVGLGWRLGPGMLVGELHGEWAPIDHRLTDDANTANLAIQLGYVFEL